MVVSAEALDHMTVGTPFTMSASATETSVDHGGAFIGPRSSMVPSFCTEYTKGLTSVSSLMWAIASAVEVAPFQYGTQPVTWNVEVAAEASTGTAKNARNRSAERVRKDFIKADYTKTFVSANYFRQCSC